MTNLTGNPLDVLFSPRSVAVIGATEREGSVGRVVVNHLKASSFSGKIYPINPNWLQVLGLKAYAHITDIEEGIDLAIIATPAPTVPKIVRQCAEAGVKACIILSAGFKETGPQGAAMEEEILRIARASRMRIVGPNCLGIMYPHGGFNATFATQSVIPGSVGFVSQSGALCSAVLDWSQKENVGFSAFVSIGSMLDVGWGDLIYYFGDEPHTRSIILYMETIGNARSFLSAAREVALTKPILVIKPGRTAEAAHAAASHTGALTGRDEVLAAAFRRCGVLRVDQIDDLFNMAEVLSKQPRTSGPRLTIVTNAGGPGVLATDALVGGGGQLALLSASTINALNDLLPAHWSHANPIDILGDADPQRYGEVVKMALNDKDSDGVLVILTPQALTEPTESAAELRKLHDRPAGYPYGKPVLASWMGGASVAEGIKILNQANIPTFIYPDAAARAFNYMWRYHRRLQLLYETPHLPSGFDEISFKRFLAGEMIANLRRQGKTLLTERESKRIVEAYGIPVADAQLVNDADDAVEKAEKIGYPVVLKINSSAITHKRRVGGVLLDLRNAQEVRRAYDDLENRFANAEDGNDFEGITIQPFIAAEQGVELIMGSSQDAQFGPVLLFGSGGTLVELFDDFALGLPPLNTTLALRMVERTRIYKSLLMMRAGSANSIARRGGASRLDELEELLVLFSQLVAEQQWIKEIEINPLLVLPDQIIALDARIVLFGPEVEEEQLPRPAIRPYPTHYIYPFTSKTGKNFVLRPIRPEDEPKLIEFQAKLSEESIYMRYFRAFPFSSRVEHERLVRLCHVDYDRTITLVIERENPKSGEEEIVATGNLSRLPNPQEAEFAMTVSDNCQGQGLGTIMLQRLLQFGRDEGIKRVEAYMLSENKGMIAVCKKLGFAFEREDELVKATIDL